ncbi:Retrovirus-related Pol polyprotein from transposon 412 [Vitis vinifera]|uniref:Retrovirus-related Pol polyprotein from transposon 412 n=1 Tax=Vitis vinifera TaxID=29760 RepID=A0A438HMZ9_VITVI|nr:Retrovirus-related Pol polyprotein from transposon 412 [Vitis vinifera]
MHPPRMSAPSCIVPPTEQLVIRPYLVPLLPTFHGMEKDWRAGAERIHEVQAVAEAPVQVKLCPNCQSYEHLVEECPAISAEREMFRDQANVVGQFKPNNNAPYGNTYNSSWRNHPNFSWKARATQYQQPDPPSQQSSSLNKQLLISAREGLLKEEMLKKSTSPPFPQALHGKKGIRNAAEILDTKIGKSYHFSHDWRKGSGESFVRLGSKCEFASISVYKQLGTWRLKPTAITLSLADRSVKIPRGPFLATSNAIINCRNGLMQLTFGNMTLISIFSICLKSKSLRKKKRVQKSCALLILGGGALWRKIEEILPLFNKEEEAAVEKEIPKLNLKPLPVELKYTYLEENNQCPVVISSSLTSHQENCLMEVLKSKANSSTSKKIESSFTRGGAAEVLKLLQAGIIYPISDSPWVSPTQVVPKKSGIQWKDHFPLPFIDQVLERVSRHPSIASWMGIQANYGVFMDDITVYGGTFEECLVNLEAVLHRCIEKDLVLNWEKCHFMVCQGIVLGHIISEKGIEVDKAKVELIVKLPSQQCKGVRQFLGYAGFYRRFIKVSQVFQNLFELCLAKEKMEALCDLLCKKTLNEAQRNYTTTEKELLAVIRSQIKDKKRVENVVADHLSRLVIAHNSHPLPINDDFPEESLMFLVKTPWYAHIANYLVTGEIPNQIIRKCVPEDEQQGFYLIVMRMHVEATLPLRKQP